MEISRWLYLIGILLIVAGPDAALGAGGAVESRGGEENEELDLLWARTIPGEVMDVTADDAYVYLACNGSGLQIVRQDSRQIAGSYNTSGLSYGIAIDSRYAYVADWDKGLIILDTINPSKPKFMGSLDTSGLAYKVKISGNYAYVCDWDKGLAIVDISNRSNPREVGRFTNVDHATDCEVIGNLVYLVDWWGLRILDISNPAVPVEVGNLTTGGFAYGVDVAGNVAYVADDFRGLRIIDVSEPTRPEEIGHFIFDDNTVHVRIEHENDANGDIGNNGNDDNGDGDNLYVYLALLNSGVIVLDISDPTAPVEVANLSIAGQSRRIHLREEVVFVASGDGDLWTVEPYREPVIEDPDPDYLLFFLIIPFVAILIPVYNHFHGKGKGTKSGGVTSGGTGREGNIGGGEREWKEERDRDRALHKGSGRGFDGSRLEIEGSKVIGTNSILGSFFLSHGLPPSLDVKTVELVRRVMENEVKTIRSPGDRFALYLAMKQLCYLLYPQNEWVRDIFHNYRESLTFDSYFDVPDSPWTVLTSWGLPTGLRGKVHLDRDRDEIVERIRNAPHLENFVIIGEPGVGKTALLFQIFDSFLGVGNAGLMTRTGGRAGNYHEENHIRLFIDDMPEEPMLIKMIQENRTLGLVVSAREGDWNGLPYEFQRMFTRLTIRNFTSHDFRQVCRNLLKLTSVEGDGPAMDLLMEYANGSPIFVWTLLNQLRFAGLRRLTSSFIRENASRGMLNYIGDILVGQLKNPLDGGYRKGGLHGLTMLYFLASHMEGRRCSTVLFTRVAELVSERLEESFSSGMGMDRENPGLVLSYLDIRNDMIRFPHDFWPDVVLGKGDRNPFSKDIIFIREKLSDTGFFEEAKRTALPESWSRVLGRYRRNPGGTRDAFLAFCESVLSNFTIHDLKGMGIDVEIIREIAALYSHLPEGDAILTRIERIAPLATQKVIEIKDSVIMKSSIG